MVLWCCPFCTFEFYITFILFCCVFLTFFSYFKEDIPFVFAYTLLNQYNYTKEEVSFTRTLLKYYKNFANFNNPNGNEMENCKIEHSHLNEVKSNLVNFVYEWPEFKILNNTKSNLQRAYIILKANKLQIAYNLRAEYCSFLNSYLPNI